MAATFNQLHSRFWRKQNERKWTSHNIKIKRKSVTGNTKHIRQMKSCSTISSLLDWAFASISPSAVCSNSQLFKNSFIHLTLQSLTRNRPALIPRALAANFWLCSNSPGNLNWITRPVAGTLGTKETIRWIGNYSGTAETIRDEGNYSRAAGTIFRIGNYSPLENLLSESETIRGAARASDFFYSSFYKGKSAANIKIARHLFLLGDRSILT